MHCALHLPSLSLDQSSVAVAWQQAHRATKVHRITKHVEREALDAGIHSDTEIIVYEGARDNK